MLWGRSKRFPARGLRLGRSRSFAPTQFRRVLNGISFETPAPISFLHHLEGILPTLPSKRRPLFRSCSIPKAFYRHFHQNVQPSFAPTPFRRHFTGTSLDLPSPISPLHHSEGILPTLPSKHQPLCRSCSIPKAFYRHFLRNVHPSFAPTPSRRHFTDTFVKSISLFRSCTFPDAFYRHFIRNACPSFTPTPSRRHFTGTSLHSPEGNARCTGHSYHLCST